jgi:hypothetical protein
MSFEDIQIHRDLPIINGFVQIPPNHESDKTKVDPDTVTGLSTEIVHLSLGSGEDRGRGYGRQRFLRLQGIRPDQWYASSPLPTI